MLALQATVHSAGHGVHVGTRGIEAHIHVCQLAVHQLKEDNKSRTNKYRYKLAHLEFANGMTKLLSSLHVGGA